MGIVPYIKALWPVRSCINLTTYVQGMSDYEIICSILQKLNEVVHSFNSLDEAVTELSNKFDSLKSFVDNYFDNLDVQDEIDNKIEEMLQDGVFNQVIANSMGTAWVNAIGYGFVGDGETVNDSVINEYINNSSENPLYFPKGVYLFSSSINFPNGATLILDPNATLKLNSLDSHIDYFIGFRVGSTASDYSYNSGVFGGTVDANYSARSIVAFNKCISGKVQNCTLKNSLKYGIRESFTAVSAPPDGYISVSDVTIENDGGIDDSPPTGTIGIYSNGFDSKYRNVTIVNYETGVYAIATYLDTVNMWLRSRQLIPNSLGIMCAGYQNTFSNITVDTYRYSLSADTSYHGAQISNIVQIVNEGVYNEYYRNNYPMVFFHQNSQISPMFNISGIKIVPTNYMTNFADFELDTYTCFISNPSFNSPAPFTPSRAPARFICEEFPIITEGSLESGLSGSIRLASSKSFNLLTVNLSGSFTQHMKVGHINPVSSDTYVIPSVCTTGISTQSVNAYLYINGAGDIYISPFEGTISKIDGYLVTT